MKKIFLKTLAVFSAVISLHVNAALVDLELQLLVDVSGSISTSEFQLQRDGYEAAFRDATIISKIESGVLGSIAVQFIEWSSANGQDVVVNWFLISDALTSNAFADLIRDAGRSFSGNTAPGSAINFGASLFGNTHTGSRQVMDISGDGIQNTGADTSDARDAALGLGIDTINGITIGANASLTSFYANNVVGGANAFLTNAASFGDFAGAINAKISREISQVPEPAILGFFSLALLVMVFASRRRLKH